jgi:hypothetical protein
VQRLRVSYLAREERYVLDGDRAALREIRRQVDAVRHSIAAVGGEEAEDDAAANAQHGATSSTGAASQAQSQSLRFADRRTVEGAAARSLLAAELQQATTGSSIASAMMLPRTAASGSMFNRPWDGTGSLGGGGGGGGGASADAAAAPAPAPALGSFGTATLNSLSGGSSRDTGLGKENTSGPLLDEFGVSSGASSGTGTGGAVYATSEAAGAVVERLKAERKALLASDAGMNVTHPVIKRLDRALHNVEATWRRLKAQGK